MRRTFEAYVVGEIERPTRRVLAAVVPLDAFTGRIVTAGVRATISRVHRVGARDRIEPLGREPIRNLSGMLVFLSETDELDPSLTFEIRVDPSEAGYLLPDVMRYSPPAANDPAWADRLRVVVPLSRRADAPEPDGATMVRGTVISRSPGNRTIPVSGARIDVSASAGQAFATFTDGRGEFAVPVRVPGSVDDDAIPVGTTVQIRERVGPNLVLRRELVRDVRSGVKHRFAEPLEIRGNNEPALLPY